MPLLKRINNLFSGSLKENICFLHVPKCGGISIGQAISWCYLSLDFRKDRHLINLDPVASSKVVRICDHIDYPHNTDNDYPVLKLREDIILYFMSQSKARYISGHFTFSEVAYREFGDQYAFITILRDPVKRWISSYFFNRYKQDGHRKVEVDIETHLQSHFGKSQGYEYVKFIGGANKAGDYISQQAIDKAKENLHKFSIVGFLEYQEEFLGQFRNLFKRSLKIERKNQSPVPKSFQQSIITDEIKTKIEELCKPDIEVYQYAVDNFLKTEQ